MKSLAGQFLVASPKLVDPNFHQTVVLVIRHDSHGALGLIVNRPMETTIDEVWDQVSESPCLSNAPLHQGGPCEGTLMVLHANTAFSDEQIGPGIFFSMEKDVVEQLVAASNGGSEVRYFVGYSGWGPQQLESEMEGGAWLVVPATREHVFSETDKLWETLRRLILLQKAYPWLDKKLIPDDPSVN